MSSHLIGHEHVQLSWALLQHADALLQAAESRYTAVSGQLHQQCFDLQQHDTFNCLPDTFGRGMRAILPIVGCSTAQASVQALYDMYCTAVYCADAKTWQTLPVQECAV